ncbi:hypothetical protein L2735_03865 [Shewanella olleyana]|uniref:hypothetical protein n=1 Tax=Shewanella olleyana TaxID=135626 RepID=UPI00200C98CF|nr:hypothetical protein [Shewanella olleyana]MCL1065944.1 hypothetical protein [Shewanella olleyana]
MNKVFKVMHMLGLLFVGIGACLYLLTEVSNEMSGMMLIASLIGVGFLIMAPYPVLLVFEWAQKQQSNGHTKRDDHSKSDEKTK